MTKEFVLKNGSIVLAAEAPGGVYSASQLRKIAALCESQSVMIKITEDQRISVIVKAEKAQTVKSELRSIGMEVRNYQDGLHQPVSCMGALCSEHEQDALGTSMDITAELAGMSMKNPVKIGVNGCAKCCTPCHSLDVSIIGESNGYRLSLGGKGSQYPEFATFVAEGIPAEEAPKALRKVLEVFQAQALDHESMQEFIERLGTGAFTPVLAPWSQDVSAPVDFAQEIPEQTTSNSAPEMITIDEPEEVGLAATTNDQDSPIMGEIPVHTDNDDLTVDVLINDPIPPVPEVRTIEVELAEDIQQIDEASVQSAQEDEAEAQLAAGISELANVGEHIESSAERDQNTESLESAEIELKANDAASEDESNFSQQSEVDENLEQHLVAIAERLSDVETNLREETAAIIQTSTPKTWDLAGFDIDRSGNPVITWSNGIRTVIDCHTKKTFTFHMGNHQIQICNRNGEIQVEIDGLLMILPSAA